MNRSLVKLHKAPSEDVQLKAVNPFSDDRRFFLFSLMLHICLRLCRVV